MLPKRLLETFRQNKLLLLLGAAGLCLLLFSGLSMGEEPTPTLTPLAAAEEYRAALTEELTSLCQQVKGVGRARVFLSLASTEIAVYEKNQSGDSETVASVGAEPLLLAYRLPEVQGVTVVCEGGDNAAAVRELYALLRTTLGLDTTKIHVAPLK